MLKLLSATIALFCCAPIAFVQITVHSEDFSTGLGTWTGISVLDAADEWIGASGYAEMNGFGGSDDEDWLISPGINMDLQNDEYFIFEYNDAFDGSLIELYYSTDYNGNPTVGDIQSASWNQIPLSLLDINTISCFSNLFQKHRAIDVSSIIGSDVYFAFRYIGSSSNSKQYRLDNVRIEAEYYGDINSFIQNGGNCEALKTELYYSISPGINVVYYTSSSYDLWDAILVTDRKSNDAGTDEIVWDMFTDIPAGPEVYEYDHCADRDNGTCPSGEGNCYNREHTLPRSWWGGGTTYPTDSMNFDLHHVVPSDAEMNWIKLNYPPGIVDVATNSGSNGFKVGTNASYPCSSMEYFEPIDEYKGDYARMYFYMATRYETQIGGWLGNNVAGDCALSGSSYTAFNSWMLNLLLEWHAQDPVSQKEIDRNNAVYAIQNNRNPFIDNPNWVGLIWGDHLGNTCSDLSTSCTPTAGSELITSCDEYLWSATGNTYNSSGAYTAILTNVAGCDSIATLNLTITNSNSGSETIIACDNYLWSASGNTYNTSGTYSTTLMNAAGCDSIATLNLTITSSNSGSETITACDDYLWTASGNTYNSTGIYTATLMNIAGCDSIATLNLTITNSSSGSEAITACDSYQWSANGNTYNSTGTYTTILTNSVGCDSIVTLDLTINSVSDLTINISGQSINANNNMASYQWLDCNNGYSIISGETNQVFSPNTNGEYAVELTEDGCVDTSSCVVMENLGFDLAMQLEGLKLYPNPGDGNYTLDMGILFSEFYIRLTDLSGRLISSMETLNTQVFNFSIDGPSGAYLLIIEAHGYKSVRRLVKR